MYYVHKGREDPAIGGIWEFMAPSFRAVWYPNWEGPPAAPPAPKNEDEARKPIGFVQMMCTPLLPVLHMFGVVHIDFWVLDVEGAELEVLKVSV